jgi:hypothetical protein
LELLLALKLLLSPDLCLDLRLLALLTSVMPLRAASETRVDSQGLLLRNTLLLWGLLLSLSLCVGFETRVVWQKILSILALLLRHGLLLSLSLCLLGLDMVSYMLTSALFSLLVRARCDLWIDGHRTLCRRIVE